MALKNPTKLVVDFNADIKTDQPGGRSNLTRIITNSIQLPFSSYNVGSVDIDVNDTPVVLGTASTCVIASSLPVDVSIDQSVITTKLFAYDGLEAVISVDTTSNTPITVEYALGIKAPSVPFAPTIGSATAGDAQAVVTFTAPQYDGGRNVSSYTVTSAPGNITATGTSSPILVTGLNNGTPYTFTVVATNLVGNSLASEASNSVVPAATLYAPSAPIIGNVVAGDAQAVVDFTAPLTNGGSAITGYTVTSNDGITATGTVAPIVVTGLTNGTAYTFTVTATNAIGTSIASTVSNSVTPVATIVLTVPDAPTIGAVYGGDAQAVIDFAAPVNDGGSAITGYTVTSNDGITATGTTSPITVTGLTNGTAYTFTVTATNAIGTSAASTASFSITPIAPIVLTAPDAPTINTVTAGNTQVVVDFTAPVNDGGSAITSYTVTSNDGITATGTASPITVTGLTNGTAYTFTVTATNAIGTSTASTVSSSVTPAAPGGVISVPNAPTITNATAGDTQVIVDFTAPTNDGGSAITGYTVTSNDGITATGTASPITVTGLTNGTAYTFTVTATNIIGTSAASAASSSVTPSSGVNILLTVPDAPVMVIALTGIGQADITFNPPANDGGTNITSYTVTSNDGISATGTASPITVTGLTAGTAYTFTVTATNAIGTSAPSAASNSVTPA